MICFNAYVCYKIEVDPNISRLDFMEQLIEILCKAHAMGRLSSQYVPSSVKENILKMYPELKTDVQSTKTDSKPNRYDKCDICIGEYRKRKSNTRYCSICKKKVCKSHQQAIKCNICP